MAAELFPQVSGYIRLLAVTETTSKLAVILRLTIKIQDVIRKTHSLTMSNLNPQIKEMDFIVKGPLVTRAGQIEKELAKGVKKPFSKIIRATLGDCHAMGQMPITFMRQVLALIIYPKLLNNPNFPLDAKERAKAVLAACKEGSVGSYSNPLGIEFIRKHVAEYIRQRDGGIPCNWEDIILSSGASNSIIYVLKLLMGNVQGKKPGILIPIPTFPLYSASITEYSMYQINYYLDETKNWALDISELERALNEAKDFSFPKAIVVINPGNPTGQVLTRENIENIIKFAFKSNLFIIVDEVYQFNIYHKDSKFHSFKKVMTEMGEPYNKMEVASFMSCSKGYLGECGLRGGYVEIVNMHPEVKAKFLKVVAASLCPNVIGQAAVDVLVNPPKENEPSYKRFLEEKTAVLNAFKLKAEIIANAFNSFEGFSCNPVQGAMYAFPRITLSPKAIEKAKSKNLNPDTFYASEVLENTGVCIIPGSGFGQVPGTYHFRSTILPPVEHIKIMLEQLEKFNAQFVKTYS